MSRRLARIAKSGVLADVSSVAPVSPAASRADGAAMSFRRITIGAQIHAVLRRDIVAGVRAPRSILSEQEIAASFGVSRTPVREAMIKLSEEGLVEIFPQYGSFVAPIKLHDVFDSQFAREAFECAAVEKAVERLDEFHGRQLKALIRRQGELLRPQDRDAFFRADEDLHMLILQIAGHGNAWRFVETAKVQMDRVRHIAITMPRKQASILAEHEAIVNRILARSSDGAVVAMRVHLRGIFRTVEMLKNEKNEYFTEDNEPRAVPQKSGVPAGRQPRKYVATHPQN